MIKQDWKREYLIKTLSRTKRKDYENFVVGAIWHKLNSLDIQPVTQQYVKRGDGKYALLDLYFPQINLGIECDEAQHKEPLHAVQDDERTLRLEIQLSSIQQGSFQLKRIDVTKDIQGIEKQVDKVVELILAKYKKIGSPRWVEEDYANRALTQGYISNFDMFFFDKIIDVAKLFGIDYSSYQHATIKLAENTQIWFPKLVYEDKNGNTKDGSKKWRNTLSSDWNAIQEQCIDKSISDADYLKGKRSRINVNMIAFGKTVNVLGQSAYKFLGVYQLNPKYDKKRRIATYELKYNAVRFNPLEFYNK